MNIVDDIDGPLDPRIQIELENLNNATDNINKLEIELEEANTALKQLLTESTISLREIINKIGPSCLEKARYFYDALEVQQQARIKCQLQAEQYQKANSIHAAAKETVAVAETRFLQHKHEWNFDQAWQEMLNHAIIKVREAERSKAECANEHQRWTVLFHDAEKKVQQLEEKYRRSIGKSKPYFDLKAYYDQVIPPRKEQVDLLRKSLKDAKTSYASSLRALEEISNQIHQRRRDYDILVNGPREPGVGAELVTPEESLSYEDLNRIALSRVNSITSSETDPDDRTRDFEDVLDLKNRADQLSNRAVDGSESPPVQWELEFQASIDKLNKLPCENSTQTNNTNDNPGIDKHTNDRILDTKDTNELNQSESKQVNENYKNFQSVAQSPFNSFLNRSKLAIKNSFSKSLTNSPINKPTFSFTKPRVPEPNGNFGDNNNSNLNSHNENKRDLNDSSDAAVSRINNNQPESQSNENENNLENNTSFKLWPKQTESHSLNSTPIKTNSNTPSKFVKFFVNGFNSKEERNTPSNTKIASNPKNKELPLLSIFQNSLTQKSTIDKSCSMINLNEKQNLKTLFDTSELNNIQAVSVERLANARHNLVGDS